MKNSIWSATGFAGVLTPPIMSMRMSWLGRKDYYDVYHLQNFLLPGQVFFDIGANFGYYSVVMASRLDKQCVIHAFEPNPPTLSLLRDTLRHWPEGDDAQMNVFCLPRAASNGGL